MFEDGRWERYFIDTETAPRRKWSSFVLWLGKGGEKQKAGTGGGYRRPNPALSGCFYF